MGNITCLRIRYWRPYTYTGVYFWSVFVSPCTKMDDGVKGGGVTRRNSWPPPPLRDDSVFNGIYYQLEPALDGGGGMGRSGEALHKVVPNPPPPYTTHSTEIARKRQTLIRLHVKNKAMKEAAQANGLHMLFPASGHRQVKTNYSGNNC